jgi:pimeloyl-ACP methyl ester carboxylesterase
VFPKPDRERNEKGGNQMTGESFRVHVPREILDDLHERLVRTRWTDEVRGAGWDYGTNLAYLKELVAYWEKTFDWRAQEEAINRFSHYRARVDGFGIHFIREKGRGRDAFPLVLLHGWPASFLQMVKIIPLLADPASHGGDPVDSFDVIVPSLPGYGFSDRPRERGMTVARIASLVHRLVTEELGYERYGVRGSDMGAGVAQQLALTFPDSVIGIHLSGTNPYFGETPPGLSPAEKVFLGKVEAFRMQEAGYAMVQGTKPQTLAYGLTDSPAGLAAWIIEKFRAWSDCGGDVEKRFTRDELLSNVMVYWATGTINSSCRLYYETMHSPWPNAGKRVEVPTGVAMFPKDLVPAPREWAERQFNVTRWTEMPRGGHFGEMEEPELLADDIRAFFRTMRG